MKSSSQLFPVELVSAELKDQVFHDVYSLKPNRCVDKSVEISLLHMHRAKDASSSKQLLFVHDAFQSHWQWMDDGPFQKGIEALLQQGYAIWLMDWRAHGASKLNRQPQHNTLVNMAQFDLTAVCDFIAEKSPSSLTIGACGFGGKMVLQAWSAVPAVRHIVVLDGESLLPSRKYWLPGIRLLKRLKLVGQRWVAGEGSEREIAAFFKAELSLAGIWGLSQRESLQQALTELSKKAHQLSWLATNKGSARAGKRMLKNSDRVILVDAQNSAKTFFQQIIAVSN